MSWWRSAVAALCFVFLFLQRAEAGPSYEVYGDWLNGGGWLSQPWGATVTTVSPSSSVPAFKGINVAKVSYTQAMGVFKQVASGGFRTQGYRNLTFAVFNAGNADDLWFVAETTGGTLGTYLRLADYTPNGYFPINNWTWVRIPVYFMGLGFSPTLKYFSVSSGKANATAYFDDVQFASNVAVYEGMRSKVPFYSTPQSLTAPGTMVWSWGGSIGSAGSYSGDFAFTFTTNQKWAGLTFQQVMTDLYSPDFGGVTIRFRPGDLYEDCQHSLAVTDGGGRAAGPYLCLDRYQAVGVPYKEGEWHQVTIPMHDLVSSPQFLGGVTLQSSVSGDRLTISDVRFVQKLQWMMPTIAKPSEPDLESFGEHWLGEYCDGYDARNGSEHRKIHVGTDYTDAATEDREVRAASRGFVREVIDLGYWAWTVVLYHENNFATSYLHLKTPSVQKDQEVQRGTLLGRTAYIENDKGNPISHLHFGVRIAGYHSLLSKAGALPEQSCSIRGVAYPGIWQSFINAERLDW